MSSVKIEATPLLAYNLTVDDYATYFVSADIGSAAVWVHNNCGTNENWLTEHNTQVGKKSKNRRDIAGAHKQDAFNSSLDALRGRQVGERIEVAPGVYQVNYQLMEVTPSGEFTGSFRDKIFTKTIYDPTRYSDADMASRAARAARQAVFPGG